jgi:drug/metabolite transporter (DMT)-like permease
MTRALLSLVLAFLGYSLHNIGQAGQKVGLAYIRRSWVAGAAIWIAASVGTSVSAFILLYAVHIGSVALVGAIGGSGLASLAIFSHWVLKERIRRRELAGIVLIFIGSGLVGALSRPLVSVHPSIAALFIYLGALCVLYLVLWVVFNRRHGAVGIVIAGFAGALGGMIPLFQKISTSEFGRARSLLELEFQTPGRFLQMIERGAEIFSNPFALLWMGIAVTSTLVMQFSYRRDKAIRVIPAFSSNYLTVPVIGGLLAFGDRLHVLQWAGVALIVGGVLLLTLKNRGAAVAGARGTAAVSPARRAAGGE